MSYLRSLSRRRHAVASLHVAREELVHSVDGVLDAYRAHPVATLVGAAGIGFILARLQAGSRLVHAGMRVVSGPGWRLARQIITHLS